MWRRRRGETTSARHLEPSAGDITVSQAGHKTPGVPLLFITGYLPVEETIPLDLLTPSLNIASSIHPPNSGECGRQTGGVKSHLLFLPFSTSTTSLSNWTQKRSSKRRHCPVIDVQLRNMNERHFVLDLCFLTPSQLVVHSKRILAIHLIRFEEMGKSISNGLGKTGQQRVAFQGKTVAMVDIGGRQ